MTIDTVGSCSASGFSLEFAEHAGITNKCIFLDVHVLYFRSSFNLCVLYVICMAWLLSIFHIHSYLVCTFIPSCDKGMCRNTLTGKISLPSGLVRRELIYH